jgi:hypothetical protein
MKLPKINYRAIALIAITASVMGLIMSPASAASTTYSPTGGWTGGVAGHHAFNSTQATTRLQAVLANLTAQGVDVSQAQTDLSAGNVSAAMQWLAAYHRDNPGTQATSSRQHAFNSTRMTGRIQSVVTKLGQSGVDVSQVLMDLASGNTHAAVQWMAAYHTAHSPTTRTGQTGRNAWHSRTTTTQGLLQGGSFRSHHAGFGNRTAWHTSSGTGVPGSS